MISADSAGSIAERVQWIDILKGLGIIAVVLGHSGYKNGFYVFFFHMPMFVFISGYLYKKNHRLSWIEVAKIRFRHLMIPYFAYMLLITLITISYSVVGGIPLLKAIHGIDWKSLVLGGSLLNGAYGVFWFVTFLFTIQILYDFLQRKIKYPWLIGITILLFYGIAHWESINYQHIFILGNVDVALFGITFYALGHFFREKDVFNNKITGRLLLIGSVVYLIAFFYLYEKGLIRFGLDLKHRQYYFFGTVILTPMSCTVILAYISKFLSSFKTPRMLLGYFGQASMEIMYLHVITGVIISRFISLPWYVFLISGLLIPSIWYYILLKLKEFREIRSRNLTTGV